MHKLSNNSNAVDKNANRILGKIKSSMYILNQFIGNYKDSNNELIKLINRLIEVIYDGMGLFLKNCLNSSNASLGW